MHILMHTWITFVADDERFPGVVFLGERFEGSQVCVIYPAGAFYLDNDFPFAQDKIYFHT